MKIGQISFSSTGGAGTVASRLHKAFVQQNLSSSLIVVTNSNLHADPWRNLTEVVRGTIDNKLLTSSPNMFSITRSRNGRVGLQELEDYDVIHLHWVEGVVTTENLRHLAGLGKQIVWTLHDMRPFSGGCHYSGECTQFQIGCGKCPYATSLGQRLIRDNFAELKRDGLHERIQFVAPSEWIHNKFMASELGKNASVTRIFNPGFGSLGNYQEERVRIDGEILIAVAASWTDPRKGLDDLLTAWRMAAPQKMILNLVGEVDSNLKLPDGVKALGTRSEDELAKLLRETTALVIPSKEENASMLISEARTIGVPLVVRSGTGSDSFVHSGVDGYLFADVSGLSNIIGKLERGLDPSFYKNSQNLGLDFSPERVAQQYLALYSSTKP